MKIKNLIKLPLLTLSFATLVIVQAFASPTTNRLVIKYKDNSGLRTAQSLHVDNRAVGGNRLSFSHELSDNRLIFKLTHEMSMDEAQRIADELAGSSDILYAYPDKRVYPAFVPNDPDYIAQWNLYEGEDGNLVQTYGLNAQDAWDIETGSSNVVVAVLDSGMLPHSDINTARVLPGYDFISDPVAENDSQPGRDADPSDPGTAVVADECAPGEPAEDSSWHGLLVSSIIIAESDNNNYMTGIDFSARLLPVRVLGKCGGFVSDINEAMRWAVGLPVNGVPDNPNPAKVINLSFSGSGFCSDAEQNAINTAVLNGAVVVAAAGNGSGDANTSSPANCENVISVASSRRDGGQTTYTNTGTVVDISAPGGDSAGNLVALTNNGLDAPDQDSFASVRGTSFSTAQVSAAASLLLAANGNLSPGQVKTALTSTAREFPSSVSDPCTASTCGEGILNLLAALELVSDPNASIPAAFNPPEYKLGGGGGCSINEYTRFDPVWAIILGIVLLKLRRRFQV